MDHAFRSGTRLRDGSGNVISSATQKNSVRIVIDGKPQTVRLAIEEQSLALVEADPCLEHNISLKLPFGTEETALAEYNSKLNLSLYSGLLHMFVKTEVCLKKDNITVNIPEPFEPLRLCIITRGEQKMKRTKPATNFTLMIVNPKRDSGRRQYKNIAIPVEGLRSCNDSDSQSTDTKVDLVASIAIPVITVVLAFVALTVAFIYHRKKKQQKRIRRSVDVNPTYGEYEHSENGEMTHNSIEVIDASPYYGDSTEGWEGEVVADRNENYE